MISIESIHVAPVKSLGLVTPQTVHVGPAGIVEDRRFYLVDDRGVLLTQRQAGELVQVQAEYQFDLEVLRLSFPDGTVIEGPVETGEPVITQIWGRQVTGHQAGGDWNKALSRFCGRPVTLVQSRQPGECFDEFPISILSSASVDLLGQQPGVELALDPRRFRPNFLLSGCQAHQEDSWLGRMVGIGDEVVLRVVAPAPRCAITTLDPDTGRPDIDTPSVIRNYRPSPGAAYFGVYAVVERPGTVALGDGSCRPGGLTESGEPGLGPALVEGGPEIRSQLQVLELPLSGYPHVLFVVAPRPPNRTVALGIGTCLKKVPNAGGGVAFNLDARVHHHVDGEEESLGCPHKEPAYLFPAVGPAPDSAVPNRVLGK